MTERSQPGESDLGSLAAEAYFYGFPLGFDLNKVVRFAREGIGAVPTPYNQFAHADRLAGPETKFTATRARPFRE